MNAHPETGTAGFRQNSAYRTTPALYVQTSVPLFILLLCSAAAAQETSWALVETLYVKSPSGGRLEGRIDWTAGTLTVTGEAPAGEEGSPARQRLAGFRAARTAALAGLLEAVTKVRVDARTRVGRVMAASGPVRERVAQLGGDARVVSGSQRETRGVCRLDVRLPLLGDLARAVLPPASERFVSLPPTELPARDSLIAWLPGGPFTGLVVDARGTQLRPSLSPRIVDDRGRVIYAAGHVDRALVVRSGLAGWERDLRRAILSERVRGEPAHPFLVEAAGVSGPFRADAVIRADDATCLQLADLHGDFLSRGRVVFVVGPKPPSPPEPPPVGAAPVPDSLAALAVTDTAGFDSLAAPVVYRDFLDSLLHARARALADTVPDSGSSP